MFGIGKPKPTIGQAQMGMIGMPVHIHQGRDALLVTADRSRQRAMRLEYQIKKKIAAGKADPEWIAKVKLQIKFYSNQHRDMHERIKLMKAFE